MSSNTNQPITGDEARFNYECAIDYVKSLSAIPETTVDEMEMASLNIIKAKSTYFDCMIAESDNYNTRHRLNLVHDFTTSQAWTRRRTCDVFNIPIRVWYQCEHNAEVRTNQYFAGSSKLYELSAYYLYYKRKMIADLDEYGYTITGWHQMRLGDDMRMDGDIVDSDIAASSNIAFLRNTILADEYVAGETHLQFMLTRTNQTIIFEGRVPYYVERLTDEELDAMKIEATHGLKDRPWRYQQLQQGAECDLERDDVLMHIETEQTFRMSMKTNI